jgi:hypothetical protein
MPASALVGQHNLEGLDRRPGRTNGGAASMHGRQVSTPQAASHRARISLQPDRLGGVAKMASLVCHDGLKVVYPDSLKSWEKFLAFRGSGDSDGA